MKHYFLGAGAGFTRRERLRHTFAMGRKKDCVALAQYLGLRYGGEAVLCKNGRSALCLALKACFRPGEAVIVNGFTCYAVYEAVKAAGLVPVFADISKRDLNFNFGTLEASMKPGDSRIRVAGIIVQNTLGNPVDIKAVENFAKEYGLLIIEDLAHSAGVRYADGREAGTVGVATALSFGKDKSIDTVSGGAVIIRDEALVSKSMPSRPPKPSDHLRARFYPLFGAMYRGLSYVKLNGVFMRCLLAMHWVERSADNKLDLTRRISEFEARLALRQFRELKKSGEPPLREFCYVNNREETLRELASAGYYFGGFWYERPVSPERYYKKVHFPEEKCPNAVWAAEHIVNLPNYYSKKDLAEARKIIKKHEVKEANG